MKNLLSFNKKDSVNVEPTCQVKEVISGKLVQCLEKNPTCDNSFYFGTALFCKKPIQQVIMENKNPQPVSPPFTISKKDPGIF